MHVFQPKAFFISSTLSTQVASASLKSDSPPTKKICFMKNVFCFILKALFVLKLFEFLSWLFGHAKKKRFDQRDKVVFKIYDMTTSLKTIIIHILANNSQSKDKQIKKSDQLMKYTDKHIFLRKSGRKDRETSSRPIFVFLKAIF